MKKETVGPQAKKEPNAQRVKHAALSEGERRTLVAHVSGSLAGVPLKLGQAKESLLDILRRCAVVKEDGEILGVTTKQMQLVDTVSGNIEDILESLGFAAEIMSKLDCDVNKRPY